MVVVKCGLKLVLMTLVLEVSECFIIDAGSLAIYSKTMVTEEDTKDKGKLYKPTSKIQPKEEAMTSAERAQACAKLLSSDRKPDRLGKMRKGGKSNLEAFMEELKQ